MVRFRVFRACAAPVAGAPGEAAVVAEARTPVALRERIGDPTDRDPVPERRIRHDAAARSPPFGGCSRAPVMADGSTRPIAQVEGR